LHLVQTAPRLIDAPLLEDEASVAVACGARHSVVLTGILKGLSLLTLMMVIEAFVR